MRATVTLPFVWGLRGCICQFPMHQGIRSEVSEVGDGESKWTPPSSWPPYVGDSLPWVAKRSTGHPTAENCSQGSSCWERRAPSWPPLPVPSHTQFLVQWNGFASSVLLPRPSAPPHAADDLGQSSYIFLQVLLHVRV